MDYKNDERYWNINLLNKWFAISSILFLLSIMWMFVHDNDDEFKEYQRDFRKLEAQVTQSKLLQELKLARMEKLLILNLLQINLKYLSKQPKNYSKKWED